MDNIKATNIFESLSSAVRLDVFRLLVKQGLDGMVAGEIASTLNIPANNLSFHLKAMTHADMVSVVQEGRYQRYRANLALMFELVDYLTEECCAGKPEQCANLHTNSTCTPKPTP